jgi:hypothetical protein
MEITVRNRFAALAVVTVLGLVPASAASAVDHQTDTLQVESADVPVLVLDPDSAVEVVSRGKTIDDGSVFYPTGDISPDTVLIAPDYLEEIGLEYDDVKHVDTLSDFQSEVAIAAKIACGQWSNFGAAPGGAWSQNYTGCAIFGSPNLTVSYQWALTAGTNQSACAQGRGWYRGYNGSTMGVWSKFYTVGCGGSSGGGTVPWGNVAASKQFKARSMIIVHAATGQWR